MTRIINLTRYDIPPHLGKAGVVDWECPSAKDLIRRYWRYPGSTNPETVDNKARGLLLLLKSQSDRLDSKEVLIGGTPFREFDLKQLLYEGEVMTSLGKQLLDAGYRPVYVDVSYGRLKFSLM